MVFLFIVLLFLLYCFPLAVLLFDVSPSTLLSLLQEEAIQKSIFITLTSSTLAALISTFVGLLFARKFALYSWKLKRLQRLLLLTPYLVPNFVLATAFVVAWNPSSGLLNSFLPLPFPLYGFTGLVVLYAISHIPVAFLLLEDRYKKLDPSLREAARIAGASATRIFFQIECRLLLPSLVGALALCAALNLSAFAIPAWIGAPAHIYPLTYKIFQALQIDAIEGIGDATALSVLLYACVLPFMVFSFLSRRNQGRYITVTGKAARESHQASSTVGMIVFQIFYLLCQLVFWIAPTLTLLATTFFQPGCLQNSSFAECLANVGFHAYRYVLFDLNETRMGFLQSFQYGFIAALIISIVAVLTLIATYSKRKTMSIAETAFGLPVATPGAIIALALIVTFSGQYGINLYGTPWILVVAYIVKHTNLAFQPLRNGFQNLSPSLLEAAQLSGASTWSAWRRILIPLLRPEIIGGFCLVLIPIVGELTMSIFLSSPEFRPIGQVMFDLQDYADQNSAAAIAIILMIVIFIINELAYLLSRGRIGY